MVQDKAIASEEGKMQFDFKCSSSAIGDPQERGNVSSLWHTRVVLGDL